MQTTHRQPCISSGFCQNWDIRRNVQWLFIFILECWTADFIPNSIPNWHSYYLFSLSRRERINTMKCKRTGLLFFWQLPKQVPNEMKTIIFVLILKISIISIWSGGFGGICCLFGLFLNYKHKYSNAFILFFWFLSWFSLVTFGSIDQSLPKHAPKTKVCAVQNFT